MVSREALGEEAHGRKAASPFQPQQVGQPAERIQLAKGRVRREQLGLWPHVGGAVRSCLAQLAGLLGYFERLSLCICVQYRNCAACFVSMRTVSPMLDVLALAIKLIWLLPPAVWNPCPVCIQLP